MNNKEANAIYLTSFAQIQEASNLHKLNNKLYLLKACLKQNEPKKCVDYLSNKIQSRLNYVNSAFEDSINNNKLVSDMNQMMKSKLNNNGYFDEFYYKYDNAELNNLMIKERERERKLKK